VTPGAIYRHFADREALLTAVAAEGFADLGRRMLEVDQGLDAKAGLIAIGIVYVGFAVERPGLFRLMYGGKPPATEAPPGEAPHPAYTALARRIGQLAKPSEQPAAFLASWSLVHGLATLLVTDRIRQRPADPIAAAESVCRILARAFD
jgi:AcrR family transcriptional regulator